MFTGGENGTYGGHVFAQAAWAAALTVDEGYMIHGSQTIVKIQHLLTFVRILQAGSSWEASLTNTILTE
jgi:acyl-CoA thioesterase